MKRLAAILLTLLLASSNAIAAGRLTLVASPFDPNWYQSYQIGGLAAPAIVLDFAGNRYYDGTNAQASVTSLVNSPATILGNITNQGLLLNNASILASGNLLTALAAKPIVICAEVAAGKAATNAGIVSFTLDSPMFQVSTNVARSFKAAGTPTSVSTANTANWTLINRIGSTVVSTGRGIVLNGGARVSDTNVYATPTAVQLGSFGGIDLFGGFLRSISVIPSSISLAGASSCSTAPAWHGTNALNFTSTNFVVMGNVLQYEYTQPWSFGAAILGFSTLGATANVIATNVTTTPAFPGIDFMWIGGSSPAASAGRLHVRLINNIATPHFIGVYGSTVLNDNKPHYLFATYDGSGTAAGVKLYVDGYAETTTVESGGDTLAGLSVIAAGQDLYIGNQKNHTDFVANCVVDSIRMSNIVRSPAYIVAHSTPATVAPIDTNTVLALDFEEGSGTTTADSSTSGFTGTLNVSTLWARQN